MTTRQYIRDPHTGKLRPVVFVDRSGNPVAPPAGGQVVLPPPAPVDMQAPQVQALPQPVFHQPIMPQLPALPPPGGTGRYKISIEYAPVVAGGYASRPTNLWDVAGYAMIIAAVCVATVFGWFVLRGGSAPAIAVPGVADALMAGVDTVRETAANAAAGAAPDAAQTPAEPPVLGEAVIPQDLASLALAGSPSVSAALMDEYLTENGSPAAGTGAEWYMAGLEYGIDPVFGMAFFLHESGLGTAPRWAGHKGGGATTHNVGNIICAGYATCYGRFRDYPDWGTGIRDWFRLLRVEYLDGRGHVTVADVIPVYAPSFENNVPRYVQAVQDVVVALRQREQQRQRSGPAHADPAAGASDLMPLPKWTITTSAARIDIFALQVAGDETVVRWDVTNTSGESLTIAFSQFQFRDSDNRPYGISATGDASRTVKAGETLPMEMTLESVGGRTLTMIVTIPPDGPAEQVLAESGQAGQGAGSSAAGFALTEQGPTGCPVKPTSGAVVMTQGYGVGSHAPAEIWGGIDLAVDGNGDGAAEPSSSQGTPIVATHAGTVKFTPNSNPGGNYVTVTTDDGVWRTEYGHLAQSLVQTGDRVTAGQQIGLMGTTGRSSGPHLHYVLYRNGVNIDPTALVGC